MQKLDFSIHIKHLIEELSTQKIVETFNHALSNPGQAFNFGQLNPILFNSKSKYDDLTKSEVYSGILEKINASEVYEEANLAYLTTKLRPNSASNVIVDQKVTRLYSFHKSLQDLSTISNDLLIDSQFTGDLDLLMDQGYLIFQIAIEDGGLEPSQYSKILTILDELIKVFEKVKYPEEESNTKIILLDSGSDTNLGIKTKVELAKSIFLIFKEIWDYVTNYKFYMAKQKNEAFMDSLTIRKEIMKMQQEGVLNDKEALEYSFLIKSRTDSLIGLKVLPKSLMNTTQEVETKNLLNEYKDIKLLK